MRTYSTVDDSEDLLTHVNDQGSAHMVDVGAKQETRRIAIAKGSIKFSNRKVIELITKNQLKKGDVLSVSRIAGIMGVKWTPNLIPLCHPIMVSKITNELQLQPDGVQVQCTVECYAKTGVEMEAMVGAMVTLTTIYDMCKAVDQHMVIDQVYVSRKTGGKRDFNLEDSQKTVTTQ